MLQNKQNVCLWSHQHLPPHILFFFSPVLTVYKVLEATRCLEGAAPHLLDFKVGAKLIATM